MKRKTLFISILPILLASAVLALMFGLLGVNSTAVAGSSTLSQTAPQQVEVLAPVTVITVTSGTDPDTSKSTTCYSGPAASPCTLRRAIVEARSLAPSLRPVLISFNIPQVVAEGYVSSLGIWKLTIQSTMDPAVFRYLDGGQITIDGSTQPGGRTTGPKIILVGPGTGNKDGLLVGTNAAGSHDGNVIRGLGFQNFRTHMYINSNNNIIEDNWFGLSDDGMSVHLRPYGAEDGSGNAAIAMSDGVTNNNVQHNVFLGLDGESVAIRGTANIFQENYVGTAADGSVPEKQTQPGLVCTTVDWLGGGGVSLDGKSHVVKNNIFAGLRQEIFHMSTQPDAIRLYDSSDGGLVEGNLIGVDSKGAQVGVCGRGLSLINGPEFNQILSNTIVNSSLSAISLNGAMYDGNTIRGNIIRNKNEWPMIEGSTKKEDAIQRNKGLPDPFELFNPAKVTSIVGTTVTGTSGNGNPCPNCIIEIFLDDTDLITETLKSLAVVTADASGNWTATLPAALTKDQGLRTTSTTAIYNTIPNMNAGTTAGMSILYVPDEEDDPGPDPDGKRRFYLPLIRGK